MKVGDLVTFFTYHPSTRSFTKYRRGIIISTIPRSNGVCYNISDGKQTFGFVGRDQIRMVWSAPS
jgi:hypothetical protein|tara:strand:- start:898 stop:1092 length:195 start_codon:yes stop_codon:yes gene_type:complete